jgi:DNA-binding GntR family transcriptional regulator
VSAVVFYRAAAALRAALGWQGGTTLNWTTMNDCATAHSANSARAEFSGPGPQDPRAYHRLAAAAREKISSGSLVPGQPLPSITELAREHGHARVACGKAYRMLEAEGLVTRYPGLGYYVA